MSLKSTDRSVGYFGPGTSATTTIDAIAFSVDTTTMVAKGAVATARSVANMGSDDAGMNFYVMGGFSGSSLSSTEMGAKAVDTQTMVAKGSLSTARNSAGVTTSASTAYVSGGSPGTLATTEGLAFAVNTAALVAKGALSAGKGDCGGCSL